MSASLFCSFVNEKTQSETLEFHEVCFSKPLTFHNGFILSALVAVSCTSRDFKMHLLNQIGLEVSRSA